ncbi:MAG: transcription termination/antitermination factor NusG [Lentisphaerae bacterium RIFOXYB12_FULL_65_16]|nr:MAG: transcription termination/antitermination factor NusG [Lentisphaerae bacterium RIFOXYA12_64_32]OGV93882.1 MAG: transcription termination/antitermination factor NusG [Lentisphaerae bacterium RIFOXYB12_FULL_65_16]
MAEQELAQWFVVQTLSGQEFRVKQSLEKRRQQEGVDGVVFDVVVPTEKVSEVRRGRKTTTARKFFPGYILVKISLYGSDGQPNHDAWYFVRDTQGVIGFIGGERPVPLSPSEVDDILRQDRDGEEASKPKVQFEVGETITIKDGAFENFEGTIESVDAARGRLRVSVSIFGRSTPVDVEYWQVERA